MADYDPYLHRLEAECEAKSEAVRQMIIEAGRPDVLAQYDEALRLNRLGVTGARATWRSISEAQRRVIEQMGDGAKLWRDPMNHRAYFLRVKMGAVIRVRIATVRALASRELIAWEGGAFEPEAKASLTERGRFVLAHGPMPSGEKFTG